MELLHFILFIVFFLSVNVLLPYLVGSIPFGLLLTRLFTKTDIRKIGSGNIGATNVLRTGNKLLALTTLILDAAKGFVFLIFAKYFLVHIGTRPSSFDNENELLNLLVYGFFAIVGHCFPVWLKFKGGKGVATTFGVLITAVPWAALVAAVTWGVVAAVFRYSSLAALCATAVTPLAVLFIYGSMPALVTLLIAFLVFWRHKDNIKRLIKGEESKIGQKK